MKVRSLLFSALMYLNFAFQAVIFSPVLLLPERYGWVIAKFWASSTLWLHRTICGIDKRIVGTEYVLNTGCLVACKHQSTWETLALALIFERPSFIYKRELAWIPLYGWNIAKMGAIPVNRGKRGPALEAVAVRARQAVAEGRQVIIFPEGTRRPPGAEPTYRYGVTKLYTSIGAPCIPIALNSGLFWPRRSLTHRPGTITAHILPPIAPGLPPEEFAKRLQSEIESASNALHAQANT